MLIFDCYADNDKKLVATADEKNYITLTATNAAFDGRGAVEL